MNIEDLKSELDTLEERVTQLEESNPFRDDDSPPKHAGEDRFATDDGGKLPFEVSPRLEVRLMMPGGCDLTSMGDRGADDSKPETFWIDVTPGEILRVADVLERVGAELRAIHARRAVGT